MHILVQPILGLDSIDVPNNSADFQMKEFIH